MSKLKKALGVLGVLVVGTLSFDVYAYHVAHTSTSSSPRNVAAHNFETKQQASHVMKRPMQTQMFPLAVPKDPTHNVTVFQGDKKNIKDVDIHYIREGRVQTVRVPKTKLKLRFGKVKTPCVDLNGKQPILLFPISYFEQ